MNLHFSSLLLFIISVWALCKNKLESTVTFWHKHILLADGKCILMRNPLGHECSQGFNVATNYVWGSAKQQSDLSCTTEKKICRGQSWRDLSVVKHWMQVKSQKHWHLKSKRLSHTQGETQRAQRSRHVYSRTACKSWFPRLLLLVRRLWSTLWTAALLGGLSFAPSSFSNISLLQPLAYLL